MYARLLTCPCWLQVFTKTHIPRALEEVDDHEQDFDRLAEGSNTEGIYYQTITGMKLDMSGAREGPAFTEGQIQVRRGGLLQLVEDQPTSLSCITWQLLVHSAEGLQQSRSAATSGA